MTAVVEKIKAAGIPADAIQTAGYNLQPEFDYANGRQTLRDYVARNSVQVRVDTLPVASAGELLEALLGAGPGFEDLERLLIERTQGNPFFLEESVRALVRR